MKEDFQIKVEIILSGKSRSRFINETSRVEINYISNTVNLVKEILEEKRNLSRQHSDNKITSAKKGSHAKIGLLGKHMLHLVLRESRIYRPNTEGHLSPDVG